MEQAPLPESQDRACAMQISVTPHNDLGWH